MKGPVKRIALIDQDRRAIDELKQKLAKSERMQVCAAVTRAEELWPNVQSAAPDVVLVTGDLPGMDIGFVCQQLRFYFPQTVCMAACSVRDAQWELFLRNLGVWVIGKPVEPAQLEMLVAPLAAGVFLPGGGPHGYPPPPYPLASPPPYSPPHAAGQERNDTASMSADDKPKRLITVYGPKGGVGKTFLSRELAIYYAQQKRNGQPLKVLAVDFNLDLGTIATSLNLPRTPNVFTWAQAIDEQLAHLVASEGRDPSTVSHQEWQDLSTMVRIPATDVEKYTVVHSETGLHVLTSPRDIRQSFEIKDYHLYVMLETLKRSDYDVILIDTAPDTTDATIQALFFAQRVVMVGNPVVDAIENIQRMLKLLREAEYPEERIHICINRLQRREMFTLEEMRAYFQLHPSKTLFTIPDDEDVKRSVNTGVPLMLTPGRSVAKEAIAAIGQTLVPPEDEAAVTAKPTSKPRSFLSHWFGRKGGG